MSFVILPHGFLEVILLILSVGLVLLLSSTFLQIVEVSYRPLFFRRTAENLPNTNKPSGFHTFTIDNDLYLAVARKQSSTTNYTATSHVYKYCDSKFQP